VVEQIAWEFAANERQTTQVNLPGERRHPIYRGRRRYYPNVVVSNALVVVATAEEVSPDEAGGLWLACGERREDFLLFVPVGFEGVAQSLCERFSVSVAAIGTWLVAEDTIEIDWG